MNQKIIIASILISIFTTFTNYIFSNEQKKYNSEDSRNQELCVLFGSTLVISFISLSFVFSTDKSKSSTSLVASSIKGGCHSTMPPF